MTNHLSPGSSHKTVEELSELYGLTEDEVTEICDGAGIRFRNFNGGLICKGFFEPALEAWRAAKPQFAGATA